MDGGAFLSAAIPYSPWRGFREANIKRIKNPHICYRESILLKTDRILE